MNPVSIVQCLIDQGVPDRRYRIYDRVLSVRFILFSLGSFD